MYTSFTTCIGRSMLWALCLSHSAHLAGLACPGIRGFYGHEVQYKVCAGPYQCHVTRQLRGTYRRPVLCVDRKCELVFTGIALLQGRKYPDSSRYSFLHGQVKYKTCACEQIWLVYKKEGVRLVHNKYGEVYKEVRCLINLVIGGLAGKLGQRHR